MLQKMKTELKNLYHSCYSIALSKGTISYKKAVIFYKNVDISKIDRSLVLKGKFSETTY